MILNLRYYMFKIWILKKEDWLDAYKNLTYKGIMAMKWIKDYCNDVKFILKIDDDVVVNTFKLINHLEILHKRSHVNNSVKKN